MQKNFMEVFPGLKLNGEKKALFENVQVLRVASTKNREVLRIYIYCEYLIEKKDIWEVEKELKKQLFAQLSLTVTIIEKFKLSAQYTAMSLLTAYKESMLSELHDYSPVLYMMLKKAKFAQDGRKLQISLEENALSKMKEQEFLLIMDKVFNERCGLNISLDVDYYEAEERENEDEIIIRRQVQQIVSRAALNKEDGEEVAGDESGTEPQESNDTKSAEKKMAEEKQGDSGKKNDKASEPNKKGAGKTEEKKFERRRMPAKSDNPDVLYGKDIEEEAMPIENILGEIGEVVIKGKILDVENRDIEKIGKTIITFHVTDFTDTITLKLFYPLEEAADFAKTLGAGTFVKCKGIAAVDKYDNDLVISSLVGIKKIKD